MILVAAFFYLANLLENINVKVTHGSVVQITRLQIDMEHFIQEAKDYC